jgi:hypothetical protein
MSLHQRIVAAMPSDPKCSPRRYLLMTLGCDIFARLAQHSLTLLRSLLVMRAV